MSMADAKILEMLIWNTRWVCDLSTDGWKFTFSFIANLNIPLEKDGEFGYTKNVVVNKVVRFSNLRRENRN